MKKRLLSFMMVWLLISAMVTPVLAESDTNFQDVPEDHWAYEAITLMAEKGIISGYDGYFRPEETVSRGEFAKMLVKTLDLTLITPSTPYFTDVEKADWEYSYVETARPYLTGFTSGTGYKFKPDVSSVREDMAVAVIKGLVAKGALDTPDASDLDLLNGYEDEDSISENLRLYVAAAIKEGIMVGSSGKFNPMGNLTRAEGAALLARLIDEEEKVVFHESKVVMSDEVDESVTIASTVTSSSTYTPSLTVYTSGNKLVLDWSQVPSSGFKYYKVVLSQGSTQPSYPDYGYAKAISSVSTTSYSLSSGSGYNGGDFGGTIQGGEGYYMAVTAVYEDATYTSNVTYMTLPATYTEVGTSDKTPILTYSMEEDGVRLNWSQVASSSFTYYKVVLSQSNSTPYYPDYGYLTYISDVSDTTWLVKEGAYYNDGGNGGIGGKVEDETYYMTITAVYSDHKYTSNTIQVTVPNQ